MSIDQRHIPDDAGAGDDAGRGGAERGRDAESPTQIPKRGWMDVLARTYAEAKTDNVPLLSAGVAFYMLLALVPAMVAFVSIYALVANPSDIARHVNDLLGAAPQEVRNLVQTQLQSITDSARTQAGIAAVIGIAVALWVASSGTKHAIEATNAAYDEPETRGFLKLRSLALVMTIGALVVGLGAFLAIAVVPAALADSGLGFGARAAFGILRWPILALAVLAALSVFYRYAPARDEPRWRWVIPGAVVATVLWLVGSALFSIYTANFGKYNETYGSLGAVVVVMLWLFLTAFAVLFGAEINAEIERQTRRDTTTGQAEPLGARGAYAADTVGETAEEVRARKKATGSYETRGDGNSTR